MRPLSLKKFFLLIPALTLTAAGASQAANLYTQGFEADTSGWYDYNTGAPGGVDRIAGTVGMPAASGSYFGQVHNTNDTYQAGYGGGGYSILGRTPGSPAPYPGSAFSQSIDVYIDTSLTASNPGVAAFWIDMYPSALNGSSPFYDEHDFALFYNGSTVQVAGDNGAANIASLGASGWYRFTDTISPDSDPNNPVINTLTVENLLGVQQGSAYQALGNSDGGILKSSDLGGPGTIWLTVWQNGFSNNLLDVDNIQANTVSAAPEPAAFALMGAGLLFAGALTRLRKRTA